MSSTMSWKLGYKKHKASALDLVFSGPVKVTYITFVMRYIMFHILIPIESELKNC